MRLIRRTYRALTSRFAVLSMRREHGQTFVEYGLLLALITLLVIGAVVMVGGNIAGLWQDLADQIPG